MRLQLRSIVVPYGLLEQASGETVSRAEADGLMSAQGYISDKDGYQVLVADLEAGQALVAAAPACLGTYTRIDDWLGVLFMQASETLCLVDARGVEYGLPQ
jgi:hypothetical protein